MQTISSNEVILTDYAKKLIRFKARQLCLRSDFQQSEFEDIQQELWMAILNVAQKYNPNKASLNTFIDRVVKTAVANLIRIRKRQQAAFGGSPCESLSETSSGSDQPEPRWALVTREDECRRLGTVPHDEIEWNENRDAITAALAAMPRDHELFCRQLMAGSVKGIARDRGISRFQVRKKLAEIRPFLQQFGLGWD